MEGQDKLEEAAREDINRERSVVLGLGHREFFWKYSILDYCCCICGYTMKDIARNDIHCERG